MTVPALPGVGELGGLASRKLGWRSGDKGWDHGVLLSGFWEEEVCFRERLARYKRRKKTC